MRKKYESQFRHVYAEAKLSISQSNLALISAYSLWKMNFPESAFVSLDSRVPIRENQQPRVTSRCVCFDFLFLFQY